MLKVICLALLAIHATAFAQNDYCGLCDKRQHIACNNDGAFADTCPPDARLVEMTEELKQLILKEHNEKRNLLAGGRIPGFTPAARLAYMQWDNDLAIMAGLNAITCKFHHDDCHDTLKYRKSGQNLAFFTYYGNINQFEDKTIIYEDIDSWWNEYKLKVNSTSKTDTAPPGYTPLKQFNVMAAEHNVAVGCNAVRFKEGDRNVFYFVCNYATTNIIGNSKYLAGPPGSYCRTGKHPLYIFLCSVHEPYDMIYS